MKHLLVIMLFGLGALFATARAEAGETVFMDMTSNFNEVKNLLR